MIRAARVGLATIAALVAVTSNVEAALYSNGFEVDIAGWDIFAGTLDAVRVPSGTNGIPSASGSFHATNQNGGTAAGNWGGYNFGAGDGVPTVFQQYRTSVDIYLDVGGGWANDTRFDFSSAINTSAGGHRRDFIFNGGFYNDATGPGAGTDRFVFSASNNSQPGSAFAKNPGRDPIAISTTGWYTFEHRFYDNAGVLAVDMNIYDALSTLVNSWTLSDPTDLIGMIGGNRYGWFDYNQFDENLAFDNALLETAPVPEAGTFAIWGIGAVAAGLVFALRRRARAC